MANYYSTKSGKEFLVSSSVYGGVVQIVQVGEKSIMIPTDILKQIAQDVEEDKIEKWDYK